MISGKIQFPLASAPSFSYFLYSLLLSSVLCVPAAFSQNDLRAQVNRGVVTLMAGDIDSTKLRIATDLANLLDSDDLRVLPIVGKGSAKNIEDLLYLKGIDIVMVQSDVLAFLESNGNYGPLREKISYIAKLYNEELHLLAGRGISTTGDLDGRPVNFGHQQSGTSITAANVFDILNIDVKPVYFDQNKALTKLRSGEIAAIAYVTGKPANLFLAINGVSSRPNTDDDDLHFLPIEHNSALLQTYLPSRLSHDDYPGLIAAGDDVTTIAVGTLMVVYDWARGSPRYERVAQFVERFFAGLSDLQRASGHPKWQEVSLPALVPGWRRFGAAETWLQNNGITAAQDAGANPGLTTSQTQ